MLTRILLLGSSLTLAVGCFSSDGGDGGDGGDTNEPTTGGSSGSNDGTGGSNDGTGGSNDGTGGSDDGTGGSDDGTGGSDGVDPYCPHAWNGFEQLDIFIAETNAIQLDPDMNGATMNAHGAAALDAAELTGQHFGRAQEFVVETETSEAFDAILLYQEVYMVPQAELAATSSDVDSYTMASFQFIQQDGVAEAVAGGTLASGTISAYTLQRCGNSRWPESR